MILLRIAGGYHQLIKSLYKNKYRTHYGALISKAASSYTWASSRSQNTLSISSLDEKLWPKDVWPLVLLWGGWPRWKLSSRPVELGKWQRGVFRLTNDGWEYIHCARWKTPPSTEYLFDANLITRLCKQFYFRIDN